MHSLSPELQSKSDELKNLIDKQMCLLMRCRIQFMICYAFQLSSTGDNLFMI